MSQCLANDSINCQILSQNKLFTEKCQLAYQSSDPWHLINQTRCANGLPPFSISMNLQEIAEKHSKYLAMNRICGHEQNSSHKFYSGSDLKERVKHLNLYYIVENVSCSIQNSWSHSIESLMSAIYHRLGFLSFYLDRIGYAHFANYEKHDSNPHKYTYIMSNSHITDKKCSSKEDLRQFALPLSPIVVYPYPDQQNVFPAFIDDEKPDPTPNYKLSGIPISVQFNPSHYKEVKINSFELWESGGDKLEVFEINATNDFNNNLSKLEFVWFPLKILKWNTKYNVVLKFSIDNIPQCIKWSFTTQSPQPADGLIEESGQVFYGWNNEFIVLRLQDYYESLSNLNCYCQNCKIDLLSFNMFRIFISEDDIKCVIPNNNRITFTIKSFD